ncbi:MAG: acyl-CoA dehydrogenase family protein [Rhodocyclaceae bacterium]
MDRSILDLPFYGPEHRLLCEALADWSSSAMPEIDHRDVDRSCRALVAALGKAGFLRYCVPAAYGGAHPDLDSRSLCIARETLAYHEGLADFAFAMQGLGSGAITLAGSEALKRRVLPRIASGEWIAAFALSEPQAGSDVAALACEARRVAAPDGDYYLLNGEKTWISNGGIADVYCVFARTGDAPGTRSISAFVVYPDTPGFEVVERLEVIAPHPLARLRFSDMKVPLENRLGEQGEGFKLAMRTLDIFRASVAAAAVGFARRALDEALAHARGRKLFGQALADFQLTQARLGEMATDVDAAALLTARAAWRRDVQRLPTTREAAMAKMTATEHAQRVIDAAVQMHGGQGVREGVKVASLYREIRALRIYEGATEVQKLIIARELLKQ